MKEYKAEFEKVEKQGKTAIERWIDSQMKGASVTVVLIGSETAKRPYVEYEIQQSNNNRMGILGIHINGLKDENGQTKIRGEVPYLLNFGGIKVYTLSSFPEIRHNIGDWIEIAAREANL